MGLQSKLKESPRKLKKHQQRIAKYCFAKFSELFQVDSDEPTVDEDANLEFGEDKRR